MRVFVQNMRRENLMPCSNGKARILLKENKAKIIGYKPFTIQLLIATGETKQEINLGVDVGSKHVGLAITSEDKVLAKGEITFRTDVKSLLETRKIYRRSRRNRKTRYRKPRFLNRKRKEGWLPPSVESRINNTFHWIDKFISLLPNPKLHLEVGKFDIQKMQTPDIQGTEYQEGPTASYHDVRYYVFARDRYTCQVCKQKDKILNTHHIVYRSHGGTDRADNLITVCTDCHTHENHQEGKILWDWMQKNKKVPVYKDATFMNILRRRIFSNYPMARFTYGSEMTPKRKELDLEKTHANDAIAISEISVIKRNPTNLFRIIQFRKKKRSLHEATARKGRKEPNRLSKRNQKNTPYLKGFFLNDCVEIFGLKGFITGFTNAGAYIKDIKGNYITKHSVSYKQVSFKEIIFLRHNNNWQFSII